MPDQENDPKNSVEEAPPGSLLTTLQAAAFLRVGRKKLRELPIPYVMLGRSSKRYRPEDLDEYVRNHMVGSRPPPALPAYERRRAEPIKPPPRIPTWEEIEAYAEQFGREEKQPGSGDQQPDNRRR